MTGPVVSRSEIGSGFALTSLPHKPTDELVWRREGHNLTMLVESGRDRNSKPIGLPYSSFARFILLFLQSEAIKTQSREVEMGRSMRVWLGSMGLSRTTVRTSPRDLSVRRMISLIATL
jgi:hypothetical protein